MPPTAPGLSVGQILKIAIDHHSKGRVHEAENLYRAILRVQPLHPDANHNLGVLAVQVNQVKGGLPYLKTALEAKPNRGQYWLSYIEALIRAENLQAARQVLEDGKKRGLQGDAVDKLAHRLDQAAQQRPDEGPLHHLACNNLDAKILQSHPTHKHQQPTHTRHEPGDTVATRPSSDAVRRVLNLFQSGDHESALVAAKNMVHTYPDYHLGFKVAAATLTALGKPEEALFYGQKAVSMLLESDSLNVYGTILQNLGRVQKAIHVYDKALKIQPDCAYTLYNKGNALQKMGQLDEAVQAYRKALELKPDYAIAWYNTGKALQELGRLEEAVQAYDKALEFKPDYADAYNNKGIILQELNKLVEALQAYDKALAIKPNFTEVYNNKGNTYIVMGRFNEALLAFDKVLEFQPDHANALFGISSIDCSRIDEVNLQHLENIARSHNADVNDKMSACFALGRFFESIKDHDKAFGWFATGNTYRLVSSGKQQYKHEGKLQLLQRYTTLMQPGCFAVSDKRGSSSNRPIFIVGFPRSGTSLLEQVLASHSKVYGAGELQDIGNLARPLLRQILTDSTPLLDLVTQSMLQDMAQSYLLRLDTLAGSCERVVDKMPHNFEFLWLIALLFPEAEVIHCRRNPVDTCLSCFFQKFTHGHHYADDLATLGQHYRYYHELMQHWKAVLPLSMHEVVYEEFIADHERHIPAVLEACGLAFEPACLDFYQNKRPVQTASSTQVRKKIYTTSIERWRNYATHLGPLLHELKGIVPITLESDQT